MGWRSLKSLAGRGSRRQLVSLDDDISLVNSSKDNGLKFK